MKRVWRGEGRGSCGISTVDIGWDGISLDIYLKVVKMIIGMDGWVGVVVVV